LGARIIEYKAFKKHGFNLPKFDLSLSII
jgi:hypothetical protein